MPDQSWYDELSAERELQLIGIDRVLREHCGGSAKRLSELDVKSAYPTRPFVIGWRVPIKFSDETVRHIDLLASEHFPNSSVRSALVDRSDYLTWPHIERDGILCLLPNSSEFDPNASTEVALNILNRSVRLVEELLEGSIVDRDFKEEFLTYWFYDASDKSKDVVTLIEPIGPSRALRSWRHQNKTYVAETDDDIANWIDNHFGAKTADKIAKQSEPAALLWLSEPPLPSQYPRIGKDILDLAIAQDEADVAVVSYAALHDGPITLILIGAEGRGGAGLVPVRTDRNGLRLGTSTQSKNHISTGFRGKNIPNDILLARTFGANKVRRTQTTRADSEWIHGRGKDPRSARMLDSSVTVFGCGSVGSFVAENLARAGTGTIDIIDYDDLAWANVGRHVLGASSVGKNKATDLASKLQKEFPHLQIRGHDSTIRRMISTDEATLLSSDLIICAIGSWVDENYLNKWHLFNERKMPILYGWTEDFAMAGSAVTIGPSGGCLACGIGRTGEPHVVATSWPTDRPPNTEPSCSDHYQPYGAIELAFINTMISETALQEILSPSKRSRRTMWLSSENRVVENGGEWSPTIKEHLFKDAIGNRMIELDWKRDFCSACGVSQKATCLPAA